MPSSSSISSPGGGPGLAADRRGRVQKPGQLDGGARLGELGVDRGREVLDVGDLDQARLGRGLDPDRMGAQPADDPPGDDLVLGAVLGALQQLLADVVVDRGVGAAPRRAGQGDRRGARPRAANQQLRAGADEGPLRASRSRSRSRPGTAPASPRRPPRRRRRRAPAPAPRGRGRPSPARRLGSAPRPPTPRSRSRSADARSRSRCARGAPGRASAATVSRDAGEPRPQPLEHAIGVDTRAAQRVEGEVRPVAVAPQRQLRQHHQGGRKRGPVRTRPRRRRRRRSRRSRPARPRRAGPPPRSRFGRARSPGSRSATSAKRSGPRETTSCAAADRRQREAAVGLLPAEPAVAGEPGGERDRAGIELAARARWR